MILAVDVGSAVVDGLRDAVAVPACVYALASIGLNLQFGYAGLLNFGSVASGLVGAYGAAISVDNGLPLWLGVVIGLVAAALFGFLLGLPTLRLRADYLAIATISAAEIVRVVVNSARLQDLTGGPIGITGVADDFFSVNPIPAGRYGWGAFSFNQNTLWTMSVGWTLVVLSCLLVWGLVRSPWGRLLKAVREDEEATRALGKNVFKMKLQAFVVGSVITAVGGILFTFDGGFVKPDFFVAQTTFNWYLVVILGGVATVWGPPVGAIIYWFVTSLFNSLLTQAIGNDGWWIIDPTDTGAVRFVVVGIAVVLLLVFRPQGILGDKQEAMIGER
jgi:branched-chain amino acid transport system permease protein